MALPLPTQIMESVSRLGLVSALLVIFIIHRTYRAYQAHREYQVRICAPTPFQRRTNQAQVRHLVRETAWLLTTSKTHQREATGH
jgi:hypothetical protein